MTAKRYCLEDEVFWESTGPCFLCHKAGVLSDDSTLEGWPLLVLPADWEPAPEPATVLRRARNALRR